jgi:hypothetical protein
VVARWAVARVPEEAQPQLPQLVEAAPPLRFLAFGGLAVLRGLSLCLQGPALPVVRWSPLHVSVGRVAAAVATRRRRLARKGHQRARPGQAASPVRLTLHARAVGLHLVELFCALAWHSRSTTTSIHCALGPAASATRPWLPAWLPCSQAGSATHCALCTVHSACAPRPVSVTAFVRTTNYVWAAREAAACWFLVLQGGGTGPGALAHLRP